MSGDQRPFACCPHDGDVLVMTFVRRGKEFVCMTCRRWFEWLERSPQPWTAERQERKAETLAQYRSEQGTTVAPDSGEGKE